MHSESGRFVSEAARYALMRAYWPVEGRYDALVFTIKCGGDMEALEAELRDSEELITSAIAVGRHSMEPGASPRIYRDAYIEGLREALDIIKRAQEGAGK